MATVRDDIEDLITCEICYMRYTDPRSLPCVHVFCLSCIDGIHKTARANKNSKLKDNEFRCPKCQKKAVLPGDSPNNLPKFFHVGNWSDIVDTLEKKQSQSPTICGICKDPQHRIVRYCFMCAKTMCDTCFQDHSKNRRYVSHAHVEVNADQAKNLVCKEHGEMVEAYCCDCFIVVCGTCQNHDHAEHNLKDFVVNQNVKTNVKREITSEMERRKKYLTELDNVQKVFDDHVHHVHAKIAMHTNKLIDQIKAQDNAFHVQLDQHRERTHVELKQIRDHIKETNKTISALKEKIDALTDPIQELASVSIENMNDIIMGMRRNIPTVAMCKRDIQQYQFHPLMVSIDIGKLTLLADTIQQMHSTKEQTDITLPTELVDFAHTRGPLKGPQTRLTVTENDPHVRQKPQRTLSLRFDDVPQVRQTTKLKRTLSARVAQLADSARAARVSESSQKPGLDLIQSGFSSMIKDIAAGECIHNVAWLPEGDILVAVDNNLKSFNTKGVEKAVPFDIKKLQGNVCSVAVHIHSKTVAVLTKGRFICYMYVITMFAGHQDFRRVKISRLSSCLSFTDDGDLLVGGEVDEIVKYNTKDLTIAWQKNIKHIAKDIVVSQNKILVNGFGQLVRYNADGTLYSSSFPKPSNAHLLGSPSCICKDSLGNIYVADSTNDKVVVFTANGQFVRQYLDISKETDTMALFKDRYLCVATFSGMLIIYNII